jgi:hypothetical protein
MSLGHLPARYQVAIWLVGLISSAGLGAWLAWSMALPVLPSSGAVVGALLGVAFVAGFLHYFGTEPEESPARR